MSDSVDADLTSQLEFGSEDLEGSLPDSASEIAAANDVAPLSVACQSPAPAATPQSPSQALSPDTHSPYEFLVFAILPIGPGDGENSLVLSIKTAALRKVLLDYRWVNRTNLVAVATFSPHEGALLASGFSKAAAMTAAPWMCLLSAACEKTPTSTGPSTIWATCRYTFECQCHQTDIAEMEPHPAFVSAIEDAVGADDADPHVQLSALRHVLAAWGPVYATRLIMGCALRTSISFGWTLTEPSEEAALWVAENNLLNAVLCRLNQKPAGFTPESKAYVEGLASQLWFSTVGGSPTWAAHAPLSFDADSLSNEEHWEIIRVDEVVPTIDLLQLKHSVLYGRVRELLGSFMELI